MAPPDSAPEKLPDEIPEGLVEVGLYSDERRAFEHSLVLVATEHACWLVPSPEGQRLLVELQREKSARWQIASYDRECASWPPRPTPLPQLPRLEFSTPLLWALIVAAAFYFQRTASVSWEDLCIMDSGGVFSHGEYWRPFTALFLHADIAHLCANITTGIYVFAAVLPNFGRARGWLLIAVSSIVANFATGAANFYQSYRSLGASTAVFAGLGLLTGAAIRQVLVSQQVRRWRGVMVPLAAGMGLLALFGSGGLHTDLTAHLMGLIFGMAFGWIGARRRLSIHLTTDHTKNTD